MMRRMYTSSVDKATAKEPPLFTVGVQVVLPAPMRGFKEIEPSSLDLKAVFSCIEAQYECKIDIDENGTAITVRGRNRERANRAITEIREHLRYEQGGQNIWRAQFLIHAPRNGTEQFRASLQSNGGDLGVRPMAVGGSNPESSTPDGFAAAEVEYKQELRRALDRTARTLRHDPNAMRMRVQFGKVALDEWKRGKTDYTFNELQNLVRRIGVRGTGRMMDVVDKKVAEALKVRLSAADGDLPESVRRYLEPPAEPAYSLVLETKNLRVETTFELVQAKGRLREKTKPLKQYTPGPFVAHRQEKREQKVEVITSCPESSHDWVLEICKVASLSDDSSSVPFTVKDLEMNLRFQGDALEGDFPNIMLSDTFIKAYDIEKVLGKVTWKYTISLQYNLEINLFHLWGKDTKSPPITMGGVMLYSDDWDDEMSSSTSQSREWDESFATQFLKPIDEEDGGPGEPGTTQDSLDHFLSWVHWIQRMLDDELRDRGD